MTLFIGTVVALYALVLFEVLCVLWYDGENGHIEQCDYVPADKPVSVILCALLPNEEGLLVSTVNSTLAQMAFSSDNELILSIVSPSRSPAIKELERIAVDNPKLVLLVGDKRVGKPAQLNAAIDRAKNEVLYFLDADELLDNDVLEMACRAYTGCAVWQGATAPRNQLKVFEKLISVETVVKYRVGLRYRELGYGNVYFCGSNALWPRSLLTSLRFTNDSLVEDIEISARACLQGSKTLLKPWMTASELAPNSLKAWWIQRRRWAKGWLDVGRIHLKEIAHSQNMSAIAKWDWIYLIYLRRVTLAIASVFYLCIAFGHAFLDFPQFLNFLYIWGLLVVPLQLFIAFFQICAVNRDASFIQNPYTTYPLYVLAFPLYELLKSLVALDALRLAFISSDDWQVTPRGEEASND